MNRIDTFFAKGRKAFVPYITAGHPSADDTLEIMKLLVDNGADIIELGMPFSDPTADGPTIQASSQRALEQGFRREQYFEIIRKFRETDADTPIIAFTYYNPIYHMGIETFSKRLAEVGGDGVLIVDVPFEEQQEVLPMLEANGLYLIQLVAPTTPDTRIKQIVERGGGFIYQIALKGVTGVRDSLSDDAKVNAQRTKSFTGLPVCMGFGVSNGEMASAVASAADGVVVGSALVDCISKHMPNYKEALTNLVQELADASHGE